MSRIRDTIELLSEILESSGASKINAELFRQAKFDKVEAVIPLWRLLFELLYFSVNGCIDDVAIKCALELTTEELIIYVKRELQSRGFFCEDFAHLPLDCSGGSRELLLAVGWFLCKENVIEKFMDKCTSPLMEETADLHQQLSGPGSELPSNVVNPNTLDSVDKVKHLLMVNGKLQHSLRRLFATQREKNILQHRVHAATQGVSLSPNRDHLSMMEIHFLRHPELLTKSLTLLEKDNQRLKSLLRWCDHEETFWKWMESALDLKQNEKENPEESTAKSETKLPTIYNMKPDDPAKMKSALAELQGTILKYENVIDGLESTWAAKSANISESELDGLIASLKEELNMHRSNIANPSKTPPPRPKEPPKFNYVKNTAPSKKTKTTNVRSGGNPYSNITSNSSTNSAQPEDVNDIVNEIKKLEKCVNDLEGEIYKQETTYREELEQIASEQVDSICIPPMARREYGV